MLTMKPVCWASQTSHLPVTSNPDWQTWPESMSAWKLAFAFLVRATTRCMILGHCKVDVTICNQNVNKTDTARVYRESTERVYEQAGSEQTN